MVECLESDNLTKILKAVSDATRRSLMVRLCQEGPCRVTDLAAFYDMSLNSVSKHLKVLESSGLVGRKTVGRTHWIRADMTQVALIETWLGEMKSIWELRIDKLAEIMEKEAVDGRFKSQYE